MVGNKASFLERAETSTPQEFLLSCAVFPQGLGRSLQGIRSFQSSSDLSGTHCGILLRKRSSSSLASADEFRPNHPRVLKQFSLEGSGVNRGVHSNISTSRQCFRSICMTNVPFMSCKMI